MAEYIERETYRKRLADLEGRCQDLRKPGLKQALEMFDEIPAADVAPVVHGRWEWADDGYCRCSECRQRAPVVYGALIEDYQDEPQTVMTYFCPHCGAMMDGGDSDVAD